MYGPNAKGWLPFFTVMRYMPTISPSIEEITMVLITAIEPNQAPHNASSLKSPYPIPSLPVKNL